MARLFLAFAVSLSIEIGTASAQSSMSVTRVGLETGRSREVFLDDYYYGEELLDKAVYSVVYDYACVVDTLAGREITGRWRLAVGSGITKFCSEVKDAHDASLRDGKKADGDFHRQFYATFLDTWYIRGDEVTFTGRLIAEDYMYARKLPEQKWAVDAEAEREVCGYVCRKAEAMVDGRLWTVWYTEEIPLPYGPWVLRGLPGLIVEAYDEGKNHHFTAVSVAPEDGDISRMKYAYIRTTKEKYGRLVDEMHENYYAFLNNHLGQSGVMEVDNPKDRTKGRDCHYEPLL